LQEENIPAQRQMKMDAKKRFFIEDFSIVKYATFL
jgi:hypothetical protein